MSPIEMQILGGLIGLFVGAVALVIFYWWRDW